jgi:hypothetical protein
MFRTGKLQAAMGDAEAARNSFAEARSLYRMAAKKDPHDQFELSEELLVNALPLPAR